MRLALPLFLLSAAFAHADAPATPSVERSNVAFRPVGNRADIPERYRLEAHDFAAELRPLRTLPINGVEVFELRFPSPVQSPHPENNTVYAEYYRPRKEGKIPCVIVLDITGGNQQLSRVIARHLAQNGIGGLFVQMAYYGPRRPPHGTQRLLSTDLDLTYDAIRQTVLDLRRATAWMENRPEIDATKLGIMGTSLGSFLATLTAEMEPKLGRLVVLLGGAGFIDGYWDHPKVVPLRSIYELCGGTKDELKALIAPIDPITHAANLKNRRVLIVAAKNDEIVPPRMAEQLWQATGRQRIVWLNAGHYSAALYLIPGLKNVSDHFLSP